ncbi:hypothetical protein [Brevibacillus panacihumi]|uniref:Uncharacterized protein n=1 Tax=Brevibacillus panacihumi TaxID=497735 RepID=A0A3M8DGX7_9BACL|nr:hypothetical protein [Brevibacillus panacihumi]RNB86417.1 hypothetical protein EDM58_02435 [Brevibacillus panacihumi]
MDIQQHEQLLKILTEEYANKVLTVSYTQWDAEGEDEEETQFRATLASATLTNNEFTEKDLLLVFAAEDGEHIEILMEIPSEEADLAANEAGRLSIFGTEAELVLES